MQESRKLIYGSSDGSADLLYAIGVFIPDPVLWFSLDSETSFIIVSSLEYNRVKKEAGDHVCVLSYTEAKKQFSLNDLSPESQIIGISKYYRIRRWLVPSEFPLAIARKTEVKGIKIEPVKAPFFEKREFKSTAEIRKIKDGVRLAELGLEKALGIIRESKIIDGVLHWNNLVLTSEIIKGEINSIICKNGGSASQTIVACGRQSADPHCTGSGKLFANQPIIIDIFPRVASTGYYGDLTRTVVKGSAPEIVWKAFDLVLNTYQDAQRKIKSGVNGKTIHENIVDSFEKGGFKTDLTASVPCGFIHGTGHGLGLEIHERPRINSHRYILKKGHVVTVEPGLYYPEWGGIRLEDVVVVRKKSHRNLTVAPVYLEIP